MGGVSADFVLEAHGIHSIALDIASVPIRTSLARVFMRLSSVFNRKASKR